MNDRTSEFFSVARSLPPSQPRSQSTAPDGGKSSANSNDELRQFHKTAADISRDIAATSAMLQELANLVRQNSLFQDDTQHINGLVMRIKGNVESLNGRLDDAGAVIARQKRKLGKNSQAGQEASNLVGQLKEEFGEAAAGFKKVLQQRTDVMKETTQRKREVYAGANGDDDDPGDVPILNLENKPPVYQMSSNPMMGGGQHGAPLSLGNAFPTLDLTSGMSAGESSSSASQLPRPHGASVGWSGGVGSEYGSNLGSGMRLRHSNSEPIGGGAYSGSYSAYNNPNNTPLTPLDIQRMETENGSMQQMQLIPDQDYLRERADAMSQVESNIVELGTIFNKLAVMVNEHKELVQRVEDNVDDANANINLSLGTLTDTLHNLQTNRALFFKILSVLVIFIVLFVVFLA